MAELKQDRRVVGRSSTRSPWIQGRALALCASLGLGVAALSLYWLQSLPAAVCLLGYVLGMSLFAWFLHALDKRRSVRGLARVSEANLLLSGVLGGGPGAWLAMRQLRHKTRTWRFPLVHGLTTVAWAVAVVWTWIG